MGFRFRQSFSVLPGVRVNISKTGVGVSAGVPGARYTVRADGSHAVTTSIPGTGLSHVETVKRRRVAPAAATQSVVETRTPNPLRDLDYQEPAATAPKPSTFGEKLLGFAVVVGLGVGAYFVASSFAHAADAEPPTDIKRAIIAKCEKDYPDNYVMQSLCVKTQVDSWREVQTFKNSIDGKAN